MARSLSVRHSAEGKSDAGFPLGDRHSVKGIYRFLNLGLILIITVEIRSYLSTSMSTSGLMPRETCRRGGTPWAIRK